MSLREKRGTLSRTYADRIKNDFVDAIREKLASLRTEDAHRRARGLLEKAQGQFDLRVGKHVLDTEEARAKAFIARQLERTIQTARTSGTESKPTPEQRAEIIAHAERHVTASSHKMIEQIKTDVLRDLNNAIGRLSGQQSCTRPHRSARTEFERRVITRGSRDRGLGE